MQRGWGFIADCDADWGFANGNIIHTDSTISTALLEKSEMTSKGPNGSDASNGSDDGTSHGLDVERWRQLKILCASEVRSNS